MQTGTPVSVAGTSCSREPILHDPTEIMEELLKTSLANGYDRQSELIEAETLQAFHRVVGRQFTELYEKAERSNL